MLNFLYKTLHKSFAARGQMPKMFYDNEIVGGDKACQPSIVMDAVLSIANGISGSY